VLHRPVELAPFFVNNGIVGDGDYFLFAHIRPEREIFTPNRLDQRSILFRQLAALPSENRHYRQL
jgi:hypothetical protein